MSLPLCRASLIASLALCLPVTAALAADTETLPSGVQVRHNTVGRGSSPQATSTVRVHYRGRLDNGQEFDSSYSRGVPASFPLNRVISCWTQGLQRMKVGGAATLICPPHTAYGPRGAGNVVPPNAQLTFEVELLAIEN